MSKKYFDKGYRDAKHGGDKKPPKGNSTFMDEVFGAYSKKEIAEMKDNADDYKRGYAAGEKAKKKSEGSGK